MGYLDNRYWKDSLELEFEGMKIFLSNEEIKEGDSYIGERNTGPQLLTALNIVKNIHYPLNSINPGYIIPKETAYYYDINECRKVIEIEEVKNG